VEVGCACEKEAFKLVLLKPLTPELNISAQRCLTRFFTEDVATLTVHLVNM
jgi:hypothetical protein